MICPECDTALEWDADEEGWMYQWCPGCGWEEGDDED